MQYSPTGYPPLHTPPFVTPDPHTPFIHLPLNRYFSFFPIPNPLLHYFKYVPQLPASPPLPMPRFALPPVISTLCVIWVQAVVATSI